MPNWEQRGLPRLVNKLTKTFADGRGINQAEGHDLPLRDNVTACLDRLFTILFPGFVYGHPVTKGNLPYRLGDQINRVYAELTVEVERAMRYDCKVKNCGQCHVKDQARAAVVHLL